ncbi:MAG: amidohydrolase family protein [Sphaerochaetaceae bacterium]|nr:amidohydrolase family protein [Sphaerochaetaceae bacterium]
MSQTHQEQYSLIIEDCSLLTGEGQILPHQDIAVRDSRIAWIGLHRSDERVMADQRIDGSRTLAIAGLIDAHTHISQQLMRGILTNEYPVLYLRFNLPFERNLTAQEMQVSAELASLEMIRSGITSFADAGSEYIEQILPVLSSSGLRGALSRPTSDIGEHLPAGSLNRIEDALKINEDLYHRVKAEGGGLLDFFFQFRSARSCSPALITAMVDMAHQHDAGIHAHISEYPESTLYSLSEFGMREIAYLDSIEALGDNVLAAHCIHLSEGDINILAKRNVNVVHCPRSNLGKGITKTPQLLSSGVSVGFGTDGSAHAGLNLFREMTAFKYSQAAAWGAPYLDYQVANPKILMQMLFSGGARALRREHQIGSLEVGKEADIALINLDKPHILPTYNLLNTLVETVDISDITDLFVAGKALMRNRCVLTLDEEGIQYRAKKASEVMKSRMNWT